MDYSITPEDREKLRQIKEQKFPDDQTTEPEYKLVEGYKHLEVLKSGHLYSLEYRGKSVRIGCNRVNRAGIASFIQDYLETRDVDEAHRRNYSSKSKKVEQLLPILEAKQDLRGDLSRLAEELDPT